MLDGVSLAQLRTFIAAVNEGSFSAGARRLHRTQSAVSELISNLEAQLGVLLFDRSERYPKLARKEFPVASSRNSRQSWTCCFRFKRLLNRPRSSETAFHTHPYDCMSKRSEAPT